MRMFIFLVASLMGVVAGSVSKPAAGATLPFFPISNIGEEIPQDLIKHWQAISTACKGVAGRFQDFPAKADFSRTPNIEQDDKVEIDFDESYYCDDGDQTTYNGLLCAAGVELGCRAVADAQDPLSGRWFRSPHRRWMWFARCPEMKRRNSPQYAHRCANGFSPDMNLGVLLYTLHTKDIDRYRHWLQWLDENAPTTELCKVEGDEKTGFTVSDCERPKIPWPRVCTEDLGYTEGGFAIFGKYGGNCALRPWDALDFAAVNNALGISPPPRMSNWETLSRELMRTSKEIVAGIVPGTRLIEGPPLIFMSLFDSKNKYPLHLDDVRVLIRMMVLNPDLKASNLPALPTPADLPGILGLASSDATDPISINVAANIIWRRNPSNPMFALLAEGPTPEVREMIVDKKCPGLGDPQTGDRSHWLWEKGPQEAIFDKNHSMGWDCVFVGTLYNKMRIRKDLWDELKNMFLSFANPISVGLKVSSEALQDAENKVALSCKAVDAEEAALAGARKLIEDEYATRKKAKVQLIDELSKKFVDASNEMKQLSSKAAALMSQAANIPRPSVPQCPRYAPPGCSTIRDAAQKKLDAALAQINGLYAQVDAIKTQAQSIGLESLQHQIEDYKAEISRLDDLEKADRVVKDALFEGAIAAKRGLLIEAEGKLANAREINARWKRADVRRQASPLVWTHEDKSLEDRFTEVPDLSPPTAPPPICASDSHSLK